MIGTICANACRSTANRCQSGFDLVRLSLDWGIVRGWALNWQFGQVLADWDWIGRTVLDWQTGIGLTNWWIIGIGLVMDWHMIGGFGMDWSRIEIGLAN